jgi:hypothetical protein
MPHRPNSGTLPRTVARAHDGSVAKVDGTQPTHRGDDMPNRSALPLAIGLAVALLSVVIGAEAPMRTEDVVRMLVSGATTEETVEAIRARDVDFDLSEEMLDELRAAGVPDAVIEAMRERQVELHPAPASETLEAEPESDRTELPAVVFELVPVGDGGDEDGETLHFPGSLPPAIVAALEVGDGSEPAEVESVAVFVACRTAYHVPDYWRSKSPLGRDFLSMPRHRMLVFLRGSERVPRGEVTGRIATVTDAAEFLRLELPSTVESPLALDEPHDLMVGLAVEVGGRFVRLLSDERDGLTVSPDTAIELVVGNGDAGDGFGVVTAFGE